MSIKRIFVLALLLVTGVTTILLIGVNSDAPPPDAPSAERPPSTFNTTPSESGNSKPPSPPAAAPPAEAIPDFSPSSPESEESDAQSEREQVDAALAQLNSTDPSQRAEGAEQLGAYPTKESETALAQLLSSDSNAEVRSTAAQSLGYVEKPSETTLAILLNSLEDQSEEVRLSTLSTLEDFLLASEEGSKRHTKILSELQTRADSHTIPEDTREAIHDVLQDQANPAQ